ncbi:DUF4112 domain-containing protein [Marinicauda algicola]|uniref:DUF4112 domain-containing protein n=1 Tax=Marinicauda algicola TaxID=2029849 RepID=A0A4S2H404_9PROT|nr:DUF4112 domain-containing protein [Marinicauda algicola]TGY90111.1 DUF4112 domain-containing protein [Marinicauda algicola]
MMARAGSSRPGTGEAVHPALRRARRWSYLLDARYEIAGIRFGLDPVIGLVPVVGDLVTIGGGLIMLASAHQLGLSIWVKAKIVGYTLLDYLAGSIPVLGDIFDLFYTSHRYCLQAIERALERQEG